MLDAEGTGVRAATGAVVPYFSVLVPVYNRSGFVIRALQSCLAQDFNDFEVVVVDDGSTDNSWEEIQSFLDPRVRSVQHSRNEGVGPARNTAVSLALGKWVILFDSDDELVPGALKTMFERCSAAPQDVGNVRFMCRLDSGLLSPDPPFTGELLDYPGYIKWLERASFGRHEAIVCLRRTVFEKVRFPNNRAMETLFHLDLTSHCLTLDCPDVVRLYHQDAVNSFCAGFSATKLREMAPDQAKMHEELLARHGPALLEGAPWLHLAELKAAASFMFLSGRRLRGLSFALRYLARKPLSPDVLAAAVSGTLGPTAFLFLKWVRSRL